MAQLVPFFGETERLCGGGSSNPLSSPAKTQQAPATAPGNSAAGIASLSGLPSRDTYCKPIGQHWGKCFLVLGCQHPARDASRARTRRECTVQSWDGQLTIAAWRQAIVAVRVRSHMPIAAGNRPA